MPLQIGGSYKSKDFKQWYQKLAQSQYWSLSESQQIRTFSKTASSALIQGFVACVNSDGLHAWTATTLDPKTFRIRARFRTPTGSLTEVRVQIDFAPAVLAVTQFTIAELKKGVPLSTGGNLDLVCTRDPSSAVFVTVNSPDIGVTAGSLDVPAYPIAPAPFTILPVDFQTRVSVMVPSKTHEFAHYGSCLIDQWSSAPPIYLIPPTGPTRYAECYRDSVIGGEYDVFVSYNCADTGPRPLDLLVNGQVAIRDMLMATTSDWDPNLASDVLQGKVRLSDGPNRIRLECPSSRSFPHVHRIRFVFRGY